MIKTSTAANSCLDPETRMSFVVASWRPQQAAACRGCRRCCYGRSRPPRPPLQPLLLLLRVRKVVDYK